MEGLIPFIYRAVIRNRNHQIRQSSSISNLLLSSAESSGRRKLFGRDHVKHYDRLPKGAESFDMVAPQNIELNQADRYASSQSVLHRKFVSCCMFFSRDEPSVAKQATRENHPAQFRQSNSFNYSP